jgi:hypothetical protein
MVFRFVLSLATMLVLCGCQPESPPQTAAPRPPAPADRMVLVKPGTPQQQSAVDRYECMQSSQTQTTRTTNDGHGTVTNTSQTTNPQLYTACMLARGYFARRESEMLARYGGPEVTIALNAQRERRLRVICLNPAYAAYFTKTACAPASITPEEMADNSTASPAVKALLPDLHRAQNEQQDAFFRIMRDGSALGARTADLFMATYRPQNDKIDLDLSNGVITWGTYNRRRKEIAQTYTTAAAQLRP